MNMLYWIQTNFELKYILSELNYQRSQKIYEKLVYDLPISLTNLQHEELIFNDCIHFFTIFFFKCSCNALKRKKKSFSIGYSLNMKI